MTNLLRFKLQPTVISVGRNEGQRSRRTALATPIAYQS